MTYEERAWRALIAPSMTRQQVMLVSGLSPDRAKDGLRRLRVAGLVSCAERMWTRVPGASYAGDGRGKSPGSLAVMRRER